MNKLSLAGKMNALGLIAFAIAIFIEVISGSDLYPKIPPGIIISILVAALVFFGANWRWTAIIGLLFPIFLLIGGILNYSGWVTLFTAPNMGIVIGAYIQLLGLITALISGFIAVYKAYKK